MIQDIEYEFLLTDLVETFETKKVKGELKAICASIDGTVRISISLKDYPSIVLFKQDGISGEKMFNIRADAINSDGERYSYQSVCFSLNDKLLITISGGRNIKGSVKIRYEED